MARGGGDRRLRASLFQRGTGAAYGADVHHRRGTPETVTFDLVPDDGAVPDDGGAPAGEAEVPPSAVGRLLRALAAWPRRRKVVAVTSVVGLVVATAGVVVTLDAVRDRQTSLRLAAAPGGVISLADAPEQLWRTELASPELVAVMGGLLVVADRQFWSERTDDEGVVLAGVDPVDGTVRWSTEVEGADWCGGAQPAPGGMWGGGLGEATALVCPTRLPEPGVAVVGTDGQVTARRALDGPVDGEVVLAAPGAVLRLARVGTPSDGVLDVQTLAEDFPTRDLTVRLEDAVTGVVRWETTVPGGTAPAGTPAEWVYRCTDLGSDGSSVGSVSDSNGSYSWEVRPREVWVETCGVNASLDLATGEVVRSVDAFDTTGGWDPGSVPLDGGGYATRLPRDSESDDALLGEVNRVWRQDGTVVGDVTGSIALPTATDGSPADVLLTVGPAGLSAFDPADATQLWVRTRGGQPLVRTQRVLVVQQGIDLIGLEPRTGRELWTRAPHDPGMGSSDVPVQLVRAFTDGHRVMLMGMSDNEFLDEDGTADLALSALDLATGVTVWTTQRTAPFLQSVGGRLYEIRTDALVALG